MSQKKPIEKKFNPEKFRGLMNLKLVQKGHNVSSFAREYGFHRNALARAMTGVSRPSTDSLTNWCQALGCSSDERAEIIASVYIDEGKLLVHYAA